MKHPLVGVEFPIRSSSPDNYEIPMPRGGSSKNFKSEKIKASAPEASQNTHNWGE
jgi:hypothetical protein